MHFYRSRGLDSLGVKDGLVRQVLTGFVLRRLDQRGGHAYTATNGNAGTIQIDRFLVGVVTPRALV